MQYGIPTVVESAVLVNDCLDLFIEKLQQEAKSNDYLNKLKEQDNYEEIKEALKKNRPHFKKVYINKINVHNKTSKELQKKFWR